MSHKVHPKSYRIKGINDWHIRGFYGKKIAKNFEEDFLVREFLKKKLAEASVANIEIERSANKINIIIYTARPGLIIGRGGEGIEKIKGIVQKRMNLGKEDSAKKEIKIEIREVKNPWLSAVLVSQLIAQQIEKRVPFRWVLKRTMGRVIANKEAKGAKIEVAGRLNGIEISRKEWLRQGRLPLQTIRADIDYAEAQAYCTYGVIGIKVWIYKGEKFE
ncbi:30S ribosomal protein S3 [Patescibacteria group bacterium]|nr:30S ribosomal protein S3 [Patescibacteria group bacterium]MBU4367884.1 30S ribosomal protein S3 [Patescibacteria group bacterium]MBU4461939.1 30S ribosomal protein S3 [Patescibacteria group bacterium]MCG2699882.1 30S ribosomal protein S3 [Candidatus Parcubacteria bacterium]